LTLSALVLKYTLFSGSSPTSLYPPSFLVCACSYNPKLKSGKREGPGTRLDPNIIPRLLSSKETSYSIYLSAFHLGGCYGNGAYAKCQQLLYNCWHFA